jgi:hypothetical protein
MNYSNSPGQDNMTTEIEGKDQLIKVVVGKLKAKKRSHSEKQETLETYVTSDLKLEELWRTLEEGKPSVNLYYLANWLTSIFLEHGYLSSDHLKDTKDSRLWLKYETKSVFHSYT